MAIKQIFFEPKFNFIYLLAKISFKIAIAIVMMGQVLIQPSNANYKPPKNQKPPTTYTESSGVRGGCQNGIDAKAITFLAPVKHVGQTISQHPEFAWFMDLSKPISMEFSLYKFDLKQKPQLIHKHLITSQPGTNQFQLPQTLSGLQTGNRYMWQLQTVCNYNRPSQNIVLRAEIERVPIPLPVLHALNGYNRVNQNRSKELSALIDLYAEHGLWYDALAQALKIVPNSELGSFASQLLTQLAKIEGEWHKFNLTRISALLPERVSIE